MPEFDPFQPVFSQRDVGEFTGLSKPSLDSYVLNGHLEPYQIGGRRAFSALHAVEAKIINMLAELFKIPPTKGRDLARQILAKFGETSIYQEARDAKPDRSWIAKAVARSQVQVGDVDIVFPVQMIVRQVFGAAKAALEQGARD